MITHETYLIEGMSCAACSASVERVTKKLDGMMNASVNLATGRLTVDYNDEKVSPVQIIQKVTNAGFGCRQLGKRNQDSKGKAKLRAEERIREEKELKSVKHGLAA